jgi:cytochrome c-type biogenesis protein CcmH
MTAFIFAALLLTVGMVALVTWPLLAAGKPAEGPDVAQLNLALLKDEFAALERDHRDGRLDDAAHALAQDELSRRLLAEAQPAPATQAKSTPPLRTFALVALLVPLATGLLYATSGTPAALLPGAAGAGAPMSAAGQAAPGDPTQPPPDARKMVESLAAKLARDPANPSGWAMLGRSYTVMARYDDAVDAYAHIGPALEGNAGWLAEYADAEAMRAGGNPVGRPEELARRALRVDPDNLLALMLASYAAAARGDFAAALPTIEHGLKVAPADSEDRRFLQDLQEKSRQHQGVRADAEAKVKVQAAPVAPADATALELQVDLAPALRAAAQGKVLFVLARAPGQRMPIAVVRLTPDAWPLKVSLDSRSTLDPKRPLGSVPRVEVEARLAANGNVQPSPDDLLAHTELPTGGSVAASLTIAHRRQ